jgi:hypothetical protein
VRAKVLVIGVLFATALVACSGAAASATRLRGVVMGPPECSAGAQLCLKVPGISAMAIAPDQRHLYALTWDGDRIFGVVGWSIAADGTLQYDKPVACLAHPQLGRHPAGCEQVHGWPPPNEIADPNGSIIVAPDGRHVYVAAFDTITAFARGANTGELHQLDTTAGCVTRAPVRGCTRGRGIRRAGRVAVSPDGRSLYVTSDGDRTAGLAVFARDVTTGALDQLPGARGCVNSGLSGCTRNARQLTEPQDLLVTADGRYVYVAAGRAPYGDARGGIATFVRDPRNGSLFQPARGRGCVNTHGRRGCRHDSRIGAILMLRGAPDGHALYSITWADDRGPLVHPVARDGSVKRSTAPARWPLSDGPAALAVGPDGRIYAPDSTDGFVVFRRPGGHRLRPLACWQAQEGRCRRSRVFDFNVSASVVPAPDGRAVYMNGNGGVITIRFGR